MHRIALYSRGFCIVTLHRVFRRAIERNRRHRLNTGDRCLLKVRGCASALPADKKNLVEITSLMRSQAQRFAVYAMQWTATRTILRKVNGI